MDGWNLRYYRQMRKEEVEERKAMREAAHKLKLPTVRAELRKQRLRDKLKRAV